MVQWTYLDTKADFTVDGTSWYIFVARKTDGTWTRIEDTSTRTRNRFVCGER